MDNETADAMRNISPRKFCLADGKKTIKGIVTKWWWLPSFLARMLVGFVFIQTALNKTHGLNYFKDILDFLWKAIFVEHHQDTFFPIAELICGALMLLGFLTRFTAALLLGIIAASILDAKLKNLTGLDLSAIQNFAIIALLAVLCAAGAGAASLDRFIFKCNSLKAN
jgi:uncharacterized membrane protein YphA (DoxX/SURF4 family)